MMLNLTFYGGIEEIGGNKVLLEDGKTRIFLDFGQSFNMGGDFFTRWLGPRQVNGLGDYFEFGLLPRLKGLYAKEQLKPTALPYIKPRFDAVFLSHAHFDHIEHIQFLDAPIPIYLGAGTKLFLKAMEETSGSCNYRKHHYCTFRTGDTIEINGVSVSPIHVDHSIPAAYGFLINTSSGVVVYTGDLRLHGPRKDMTQEFTESARDSNPVAMICEGTRMVEKERRKNYSEEQVEKLGERIVSATDKIVFVAHYSRDMDRFRSFYRVAKKCGRQLVVFPKTAYLLSKLTEDERLDLPDPIKDDDILVYYPRKKTGEHVEKDYYGWERFFMDKMITCDFVRTHQRELVMDLDLYRFGELIDIRPDPGCHFIHSMSEPRSEEDIEDQVMHNWLNHFNMKFHQLHASGHMDRGQLIKLVEDIKPEWLFPVHTENTQLFKKTWENVKTIKTGEKYTIK